MTANNFEVIGHQVDFDTKNADVVQAVIKMVNRFFEQGKENGGCAINPAQFFSNDREMEVAFTVISGFCKEGSFIVVADAANPWVAKFRWIIKNGKVTKEMPKIVWEAQGQNNSGNNNQQNNNKPNNNQPANNNNQQK